MKSKEEILKEAYDKIEAHQRPDSLVDVILLEAMEEYASQSGWVKVSEAGLPAKPNKKKYEQIMCLVVRNGRTYVEVLMWNCEHKVWDGADGDDFECNADEVEWYKIVTTPQFLTPKEL